MQLGTSSKHKRQGKECVKVVTIGVVRESRKDWARICSGVKLVRKDKCRDSRTEELTVVIMEFE